MNVYLVWTEMMHEDGWQSNYHLFIEARTPSHAKLVYADEGGWGDEVFDKQPEGFRLHCLMVEKDTDYGLRILDHYERMAGVDLILSGVLTPMWMLNGYGSYYDDYRQWDGFRKVNSQESQL